MGRRRSRGTAISQKICYIQLKSCPISTIQFCARTCVQFNATDIAYPYHTYVYISTPEHFTTYLLAAISFSLPSSSFPSTFPNSPLLFSFVIRCFIVTRYNRRINKDKIESKGNVEFFFSFFSLFRSINGPLFPLFYSLTGVTRGGLYRLQASSNEGKGD